MASHYLTGTKKNNPWNGKVPNKIALLYIWWYSHFFHIFFESKTEAQNYWITAERRKGGSSKGKKIFFWEIISKWLKEQHKEKAYCLLTISSSSPIIATFTTSQERFLGINSRKPIVVQLPSHIWLHGTPWTEAHQASLFLTIAWSLPKFMPTDSVMLSYHNILCHPLLLPSIFPRELKCLL